MSNDPLDEDKIRELCGCDACDMCDRKDPDFGADCDEYEALQEWKRCDDERRDLGERLRLAERRLQETEAIVDALAKCDPVWDGECVFCGQSLDRFEDGPEEHGPDCAWRLARKRCSSPSAGHGTERHPA